MAKDDAVAFCVIVGRWSICRKSDGFWHDCIEKVRIPQCLSLPSFETNILS